MFMTVTPVGARPITINFGMVQAFSYDKKKKATLIQLVTAGSAKLTDIFVTESVDTIQNLLAIEGMYCDCWDDESASGGKYDDEVPYGWDVLDSDDEDSLSGLACIAYGDYIVEARYDKESHSIRPYLYSTQEAKYLADAMSATPENLASLIREIGNVIANKVLADGNAHIIESGSSVPKTKAKTKVRSPSRRAKRNPSMRLVKTDENESNI